MALDPLTEGLHLGGSIVDLIGGILSRADRDAPDKELNENIINIQNSFAHNDLDEQFRIYYKLFTDARHAPTPGGTMGTTDREFRHAAFLIAAELIYAKRIIARLVAKSVKE